MQRRTRANYTNIQHIKEEILGLLGTFQKTVFEKYNDITGEIITRDVYFLNSEQFNQIFHLDIEARNIHDVREPLYDIISFRTTLDNPIWRYSDEMVMKLSSSTITDQGKIKDEIPRRLSIYINKQKKYLRDYIKSNNSLKPQEISNLEKELELKLEKVSYNTEKFLENFDNYRVQISSYAKKEKYPYLYCNFHNHILDSKGKKTKKKATDIPLRQDVANIFYFEEKYDEMDDNLKSSASVMRFIKDAECLFEDIYYKNIPKLPPTHHLC